MVALMEKMFEKMSDKVVCACVCVCLLAYEANFESIVFVQNLKGASLLFV